MNGIGSGSDISSAFQAKQIPITRYPHQLLLNRDNRCLAIRSIGWSRRSILDVVGADLRRALWRFPPDLAAF